MSKYIVSLFFSLLLLLLVPFTVSAHCDTLDGPVVNAARKAIDFGNVNYALIWVKPENEDEVKKALKRAREKIKKAKNTEEKDAATTEFFEDLVKIHREGEGAKYEGLKPAGSVDAEIALADKAVETGKLNTLLEKIKSDKSKHILKHLFHNLQKKSNYPVEDLKLGREYVESYVNFIHSYEAALKGKELYLSHSH